MKNITFTPKAYDDYLFWLQTDKKLFNKLTKLIGETAKTPTQGSGKPEFLKYEFSGLWSRRINQEHRLIYSITENAIVIISCKYHYL